MKIKTLSGLILFCVLVSLPLAVVSQTSPSNELPQFIFPKFTKGIVKMKAGNSYAANLNYNMADQEMVFEQKGVYLVLDKPQEIDTVTIQNRQFVPVGKVFYEVLAKGKFPVYMQHISKYVPVASNTAYGMKSQTLGVTNVSVATAGNQVRTLDVPDNVTVSHSQVNWVEKDGKLEKFNTTNQLIKLFPEKESEIKSFVKENKIDFKVLSDIIKIGKFINL
jgi:hypothetical protein